jgi:23S rRNA pseudouridine1911/1915/1917 synthase
VPKILFEDEHCVAVVKPAGQFPLGVWAPPGESTLESVVRRYLDATNPRAVYLGIVHRLDRATSGVLIWAKTPKAARRLSSQFEERRAIKEYWAVVAPPAAAQSPDARAAAPWSQPGASFADAWVDFLTRPDRTGVVRVAPESTRGAREAITELAAGTAVAVPAGCLSLTLWPKTGRAHQLRVQAAARGTPIIGDAVYGSDRPFDPPHAIALHARRLRVRHPITGVELELCAPVPIAWAQQGIIF